MTEGNEITRLYHRGLRDGHGLVNSFEALTRAKNGDILEMDVFLLKDGSLGMTHHRDIGLDMDQVEDMDVSAFQELDNPGKNVSPEQQRIARMPLYEEALFQASDRGVGLYIELKASSVEKIKQLVEVLVERMTQLQDQGAFENDRNFIGSSITFFSMSVEGVKYMAELLRVRKLDNHTILGWPSSEEYAGDMKISQTAVEHAKAVEGGDWFEKGIQIAKKIGSNGILIYADKLIQNPHYIELAHNLGLEVLAAGLVQSPQEVEVLKKLGVDTFASEILP